MTRPISHNVKILRGRVMSLTRGQMILCITQKTNPKIRYNPMFVVPVDLIKCKK